MKSDLIDIEVCIHYETDKAILVSIDGEKENSKWLPKSQIEIHKEGNKTEITLPEWLAKDRGLI